MMLQSCNKFHLNIFYGFKAAKIAWFSNLSKRGQNSESNVIGVMILYLCPLSDDALYLYKDLQNISKDFRVTERTRSSR